MNSAYDEGGRRRVRVRHTPCTSRAGILRLVRRGGIVHFLSGQDGSAGFHREHKIRLGPEEVLGTRFQVEPFGPQSRVEVRWKDLRIRAEKIVGMSGSKSSPRPAAAAGPTVPPELNLERLAVTYHHDFRRSAFDYRALQLVGTGASQLVKAEEGGLRIRMPVNVGKVPPVGIAPRFRVHGDFEITASYEILKAAQPKGDGPTRTRLQISAHVSGTAREELLFSLGRAPSEGFEYTTTRGRVVSSEPEYRGRRFPADAQVGRLRLVRVGQTAHFLRSKGEGSEFEHLFRIECRGEDLTPLRFWVIGGHIRADFEVCLKDVTIRAEKLPGWTGSPPESRPGLRWLAGIIVFVLVALGCGLWWLARSRRGQSTP